MDTHDPFISPKTSHPLKILIAGAGIAGLTCAIGLKLSGHDVEIFEQAHEVTEVGAGIQMAPNATRIMARFGLLDKIMEKANVLQEISLRRWENNEELGSSSSMNSKYHAPLTVIHRADLQTILLQKLHSLSIPLHLSTKIISANPSFSGRIQLSSGEWRSGDIIICADGIKSILRQQISLSHSTEDRPHPTGDAAYRVLLPKEVLRNDKEALALLKEDIGMRWLGPNGHIMAYPLKNNTIYNMVLLHPDASSQTKCTEGNWTSKGNKTKMLDFYQNWNPIVRRLLGYVPDENILEWSLNTHSKLTNWVEGRRVLVGDAAHPMLPYVAQGAAQGIEDAGVLSCVLALIPSDQEEDVKVALRIYELVRKERGERIQDSAMETRRVLHLVDGKEQRERDRDIRNGADGKNPDLWSDEKWRDFMWGADVMRDCVEGWDEWVLKVRGEGLEADGAA